MVRFGCYVVDGNLCPGSGGLVMTIRDYNTAKRLDLWVQRRDSWAKELELVRARKRTAEIYEDRCQKALADAESKVSEWRQKYMHSKAVARTTDMGLPEELG